jgi:hypothetical protein
MKQNKLKEKNPRHNQTFESKVTKKFLKAATEKSN